MRLQSHLNREAESQKTEGQRTERQRTEGREQRKSGAIRTICVSFALYRLFRGGLGRVCLNSRTRRPSPKTPPYIVYQNRASPYRLDGDFCHCRIEDWGDIRFVCGGRKSRSRAVPLGLLCSALCFLFSASVLGCFVFFKFNKNSHNT